MTLSKTLAIASLIAAATLSPASHAGELVTFKATMPFVKKAVQLRAELFVPRGSGPFPAVVLMHGCGGWQPAVLSALHSHAMTFLDRGYVVLNLDSFGPRGNSGGVLCGSNSQLRRALVYRQSDAADALRYLRSLDAVDADNIYLLGQSNGGSVAIDAAKMADFRAVAAYYPWCGSLGGSKVALTSPLIIFAGGRDDWTPAWECRGRRARNKPLTLVEYPKAPHSFDVQIEPQRYLGKLLGYDRDATADSRTRMLAFFAEARKISPPTLPLMAHLAIRDE